MNIITTIIEKLGTTAITQSYRILSTVLSSSPFYLATGGCILGAIAVHKYHTGNYNVPILSKIPSLLSSISIHSLTTQIHAIWYNTPDGEQARMVLSGAAVATIPTITIYMFWDSLFILPAVGFSLGVVFFIPFYLIDDHIYDNVLVLQPINVLLSQLLNMQLIDKAHDKLGEVVYVTVGGIVGSIFGGIASVTNHMLDFQSIANTSIDFLTYSWDYVNNNDILPVVSFIIGSLLLSEHLSFNYHYINSYRHYIRITSKVIASTLTDASLLEISQEALFKKIAYGMLSIASGLETAFTSTMIGAAFNWEVGSTKDYILYSWNYTQNHYLIPTLSSIVGFIGGYYVSWHKDDESLVAKILIALLQPTVNNDLFHWAHYNYGHAVPGIVEAITFSILSVQIAIVADTTYKKTTKFINNILQYTSDNMPEAMSTTYEKIMEFINLYPSSDAQEAYEESIAEESEIIEDSQHELSGNIEEDDDDGVFAFI
ncbi:MAG: hypothetical protein HRU36_04145 [Rickettsiales bacterium]|nr:hypothetical protein [Rickettsiales bacterium]